jgi:hypothetical protein
MCMLATSLEPMGSCRAARLGGERLVYCLEFCVGDARFGSCAASRQRASPAGRAKTGDAHRAPVKPPVGFPAYTLYSD